MKKVIKSNEQWKKELTPEQYHITREKGTERPFSGKYNNFKGKGTFHCVACGAPLFNSDSKFNSGSGWPSFWQPHSENAVETAADHSHGMTRTEVLCANCDAHLGHVFNDGPQPTGLRFCINSVSIDFKEK